MISLLAIGLLLAVLFVCDVSAPIQPDRHIQNREAAVGAECLLGNSLSVTNSNVSSPSVSVSVPLVEKKPLSSKNLK